MTKVKPAMQQSTKATRGKQPVNITVETEELPVEETVGSLVDFEFAGLPDNNDWVGDGASVLDAGVTGTTMFMPQELLVYYSLDEDAPPIQRTASHDLQSFFWVILYVLFKHTFNEADAMGTAALASIPDFSRKALQEEHDRLFSAKDIKTLADNRKVAFDFINAAGAAYAGIQNLMTYIHAKDSGFSQLLFTLWGHLRLFQPVQGRKFVEAFSAAIMFMQELEGASMTPYRPADAPVVEPSSAAKELNHARLTDMLEMGIKWMDLAGSSVGATAGVSADS